jgi:phospholipase D1/2
VNAKYLINGKEYFAVLLETLERAKHRVFIAGWYLSPGLFLKRDPVDEKSRLDKVLYKTAERVCNIFV